ncbi:MAG TPA: hypothetical protein VMO47_13895 [Rhodothermales bacterium]|nr:hypothetical protein [Rhodothermales bacterium]
MTHSPTVTRSLAIICGMAAWSAECRYEGPSPAEGTLEHHLVNESWSWFSEPFSSDRGYRVAFLPFKLVVHESGRMSETWTVVNDEVLELTNTHERRFRYRWFDSARLLAHCREGTRKPFFIAPDTLLPHQVFESAGRSGLDTCTRQRSCELPEVGSSWPKIDRDSSKRSTFPI